MNKGFCEKCNSLVEYEVKEINDSIEIKGKEYNYKRLIGYCKNCGEEISYGYGQNPAYPYPAAGVRASDSGSVGQRNS